MNAALRIVENHPTSPLSDIHPLVADAPLIIEQIPANPDAAQSSPITSVTFGARLGGAAVLDAISQPVAPLIPHFTPSDITHGLRALTYPNSRVMRNVSLSDPYAPAHILQQRPQIRGLIDAINHDTHHEMVPAKVRVIGRDAVELVIRDVLAGMKPSELVQFCADQDISVDQLRVWRLKHGDRGNRYLDVARLGLDATTLIDLYKAKHYREKIVIPGKTEAYVPVEDLPNTDWALELGYLELIRRLPPHTPTDDIERYVANIHKEGTPRHVVRPQIRWQTTSVEHTYSWLDRTAEYHRQRYSWRTPRTHLVFTHHPPEYDPVSHVIIHTSTYLGGLLLAASLPPEVVRQELRTLQQGNHLRYWDRVQPEPKMAGQAIALLHSPYIMGRIMSQSLFRQFRQLATAK